MKSVLSQEQADQIVALTKQVGEIVRYRLKYEHTDDRKKPDGSWVTSLDDEVHLLMSDGLKKIAPGIQILSEEDESNHHTFDRTQPFFTLDPIDGTSLMRSFVDGDETKTGFSILVGLVEEGKPTFGAVHYPAMGEAGTTYFTNARCNALFEQKGEEKPTGLHALTNLPAGGKKRTIFVGSGELRELPVGRFRLEATDRNPNPMLDRMLRLAKGEAYVAHNNYSKSPPGYWDLAPFQAMFKAAGGTLLAFSAHEHAKAIPADLKGAEEMGYDGTHDVPEVKSGPYLRKSMAGSLDTLRKLGWDASLLKELDVRR